MNAQITKTSQRFLAFLWNFITNKKDYNSFQPMQIYIMLIFLFKVLWRTAT